MRRVVSVEFESEETVELVDARRTCEVESAIAHESSVGGKEGEERKRKSKARGVRKRRVCHA